MMDKNYRNRKLLRLAKECPRCMLCGKCNEGDVVAAHSNRIMDGKGMGIKSHDFRIAYLCHACHMEIDQGHALTKAMREFNWERAHRETIGWLFQSGHLEVAS